ncbi:MAG: nucleoside hydrolase [Eubacteriales bacterium]|nr:nucleoside hydrolase [Eubacteriales bacterium]
MPVTNNKSHKIYLDCDPGVDDACAILAAFTAPELEILGVSSVSGNVPLDLTTTNLARLLTFMGVEDIFFAAGAASPLEREGYFAIEVHGPDGLGGVEVPPAEIEPGALPAFELIYFLARQNPGQMELVATGPLTNIALALERHPDLVDLVSGLVIMGGGHARFNAGKKAEFNIYADPEAARIVFDSALQVDMIGLDVTQVAAVPQDFFQERGALSPRQDLFRRLSDYVAELNRRFGIKRPVNLHDLTTLMYVMRPEIFELQPARVSVHCEDGPELGRTECDFSPEALAEIAATGRKHDRVALDFDKEAYTDFLEEVFERLA